MWMVTKEKRDLHKAVDDITQTLLDDVVGDFLPL